MSAQRSTDEPTVFDLLVVGSGPAGVNAAVAYVRAGGAGVVGLLSADQDPPYERPPLSKGVLSGDEAPGASPLLTDEDEDDRAAWAEVDVRLGAAVDALDTERRTVRTAAGHEHGYRRLVIATGSEPVSLPGTEEGAPVFALRSLEQARRLVGAAEEATTAVVLGSGFIGCEAAAALSRRGVRTTLVTPEPAPQSARLGDWVGARIMDWLAELDVEVVTETKVDGVDANGTLRLDDGSEIGADLVLAAVGVTQSRPFLDASGLRLDEGRVVVDADLRTSDPRVWAAGDVAQARHDVADRDLRVEHWGDAVTMGGLAGANAAAESQDGSGQARRWSDPPGFWSEIGEHTLKHSAWGDGFASTSVVEHGNGAFTVWYADASNELVGVLTHDRDEDYERGAELLARRASLDEAPGQPAGG